MTHVVAPALKRSVKTLAGMAAGSWVLSTSFLTASATRPWPRRARESSISCMMAECFSS